MSSSALPYIERPPKAKTTGKPPLLVLLHGRDANAETIFSVEHLLPESFHIISIRATYKSPREGYEWYKPYDYDHPLESFGEEHFRESLDIVTPMIASLLEEKDVDKEKLFLLGFSQGAAMCHFLGLEGKLNPIGVVPMSGFFPRPIEKWTYINTNAKFLITHGTEDKVLSTSESVYGLEFLTSKGIEADYYEYKGRHKMTVPLLHHITNWLEAKV
jgi:phospholipase/carboxylesterase